MTRMFNRIPDFDRIFSDLAHSSAAVAMPMDVYREGDKFVAEIDLPGVDPANIDVDVEDRTLTIRAERQGASDETERDWFTRERRVGTFVRQLTLGHRVALDQVEAAYSDGVIRLVIPLAEESKPRKISVAHVERPAEVGDAKVAPAKIEADKATENK